MSWNRKLWGVEFCGSFRQDPPSLLGRSWHDDSVPRQYPGEPTRALLFRTRREARAWCRHKVKFYAGLGDVCSLWRFSTVRVIERVEKI